MEDKDKDKLEGLLLDDFIHMAVPKKEDGSVGARQEAGP